MCHRTGQISVLTAWPAPHRQADATLRRCVREYNRLKRNPPLPGVGRPRWRPTAHPFPGLVRVLVLGIETSCDETGIALYDSGEGLLANALYSQAATHAEYGGVVPEIASRDHIRKTLPLIRQALDDAGKQRRRPRWRRLHGRSGTDRRSDGRRGHRSRAGMVEGDSGHRRASHGGASARAPARRRKAVRCRSWRCWFPEVTRNSFASMQ